MLVRRTKRIFKCIYIDLYLGRLILSCFMLIISNVESHKIIYPTVKNVSAKYLGCEVAVISWSNNCPHCASISVTEASVSFAPWTTKLTNLAEDNGPPSKEVLMLSTPSPSREQIYIRKLYTNNK